VNIPIFHLWAWDSMRQDGLPVFDTGVIVGRAVSHKTPVFVADMRSVLFRPYWNVPLSIVRQEILPALARDPGYLQHENMEVVPTGGEGVSVEPTEENLRQLREGKLSLRQRPGPANALGLIKFDFPNENDVYMHATPAQALFSQTRRDFSHGCVRVENPIALAEWVLSEQPEWTRERIVSAMQGSETLRVDLARPFPVILFYVTAAFLPRDGTIHFAEDIYRHDATLDRALARHARTAK
jgi:murein L,D-transpeptidase YcbB/YkuD